MSHTENTIELEEKPVISNEFKKVADAVKTQKGYADYDLMFTDKKTNVTYVALQRSNGVKFEATGKGESKSWFVFRYAEGSVNVKKQSEVMGIGTPEGTTGDNIIGHILEQVRKKEGYVAASASPKPKP